MSGSDAKQKRQQQRAEGLDKWQSKELKQEAEKKKARRRAWIATPIVVLILAFIILANSSLAYDKLTAVRAGNTSFTAADFNYYYQTVYQNFQTNYGNTLSSALGTAGGTGADQALDLDQMFDDNQTLGEYLVNTAVDTMKETAALCEAAEKDGFTLSQEELDEMEENIQAPAPYLSLYGYKTLNQYYSKIFGRGTTEEVYRRNVERVLLSSSYGDHVKDTAEFPEEEIQSQYTENQESYDKVIYRFYYISSGTNADTEESEREAGMAQAKAAAEEFAAYATTEEKFMERALELMEADETKTEENIKPYRYSSGTMRRYAVGTLASNYSDWLRDSSREYGDVEALESSNGYAVVFYIGVDDSQYNTRQIRHLLINVGTDGEDDEPGTALKEAHQKAEDYLAEWKENGGDEEAFSKLAQTYSADTETYEAGGLVENAYWGQLATDVEEWIFDNARKAGDVETIEAEDGLHIIYYIGETDEEYWHLAALNTLKEDYYKEWKAELVKGYTAEQKLGMKFTTK